MEARCHQWQSASRWQRGRKSNGSVELADRCARRPRDRQSHHLRLRKSSSDPVVASKWHTKRRNDHRQHRLLGIGDGRRRISLRHWQGEVWSETLSSGRDRWYSRGGWKWRRWRSPSAQFARLHLHGWRSRCLRVGPLESSRDEMVKGAKEGIVVAGGQGKGNNVTQLSYPHGMRVDAAGTVYVADHANSPRDALGSRGYTGYCRGRWKRARKWSQPSSIIPLVCPSIGRTISVSLTTTTIECNAFRSNRTE